jgi:murein tripeptide amidase MpaA
MDVDDVGALHGRLSEALVAADAERGRLGACAEEAEIELDSRNVELARLRLQLELLRVEMEKQEEEIKKTMTAAAAVSLTPTRTEAAGTKLSFPAKMFKLNRNRFFC